MKTALCIILLAFSSVCFGAEFKLGVQYTVENSTICGKKEDAIEVIETHANISLEEAQKVFNAKCDVIPRAIQMTYVRLIHQTKTEYVYLVRIPGYSMTFEVFAIEEERHSN